jgi:hypothetical protein
MEKLALHTRPQIAALAALTGLSVAGLESILNAQVGP